MDDAVKLQKIAAARNKLKNHQQKKQKKPEATSSDSKSVDSVTSSIECPQTQQSSDTSPVPQIQSYFTTPPTIPTLPTSTATYFDNVSSVDCFSIQSQVEPSVQSVSPPVPPSAPSIEGDAFVTSSDAVTYEDPEINPNEVFEYATQKHKNIVVDQQQAPELSMTEQLKQLNSQIAQVVDSNGYGNYSNYSDLEKRNLELASNYEKEKLQCEQLHASLQEHKDHISQIEQQTELLKVECENKIRNELGLLQNEIAMHRQTLGILVGEKTELSASLNHTQMMLKHKTTECEELQARLKTSRSRVADVERELTSLKEERGRHAQMQTGHTQEYERLQNEFHQFKAQKAEAEHDLNEMRERLKKLQEENIATLRTCNEYEGKLDLANIKIQQLTTGAEPNAGERFMLQKQALEKQILDLNSSLKNALAERDQANTQYQQYAQQLNGNISSLAEKLDASTADNDNLRKREHELVQHISELERRLQSMQQETGNDLYKQPLQQSEPDPNLGLITRQNQELEATVADLQLKFEAVCLERDEFIKDVEQKKVAIEGLEATIERLEGNQSNHSQMLADIESEKVAASRAVAQNIKLKQQLEEMQDAFIRMTNDKAELLTQLSSEQFRFKELEEMQAQASHQLRVLSDAIEIKDHELTQMRDKLEDVDKHALHQDQLNDRLRHYEAHENSAQALSHELQHAKEEIYALLNKNKHLEGQLAAVSTNSEVREVQPDSGSHDQHAHDPNDPDAVTKTAKEQAVPHSTQTDAIEEPVSPETIQLPQGIDTEMTSAREMAMRLLETKFMRTMQEIANLQDEKQMLEHIVLQLQGETETIGEYIALYQHQRGVLKQRAIEKETQLKQLAKDREHMKFQLHMLNELIRRLLDENKISEGVLQEQQQINENAAALCEEHAKLHQRRDGDGDAITGGVLAGQQTAQQIITLLGEIKTSNLVQPTDVSDSFHPCPLCSGQLITV